MQMIVIDKSKFPPGALKLLDAMQELNGHERWIDRIELAKHLNKSILNAGDMAFLDMLVAIGMMENKQTEATTPTGWKWVYRLTESES